MLNYGCAEECFELSCSCLHLGKRSDDRDLLFNFHGRSAANHEYYQNIDVRSKILMVFEKYPDVSVGHGSTCTAGESIGVL